MSLKLPKIYKIGILSVISIVVFSFTVFYSIQIVTEENVKNNLISEQINRQQVASKSLSQHIGSDLTLVTAVLDGLANSIYMQDKNLDPEKTSSIINEKYNSIDDIIDRIFILDKDDVVTTDLSHQGTNLNVGSDFSQREWVEEARNNLKAVFSKGFEGQGIYSIFIAVPMINRENNQYLGLIGASIPTEKFFSRYGNVHDINSQFLVVYDKSGTILAVGADRSLVGKNFFSKTVQGFITQNEILNNLTRTLLAGKSNFGVYDYGRTERINTGQPVLIQDIPTYFIQVVTPTREIFAKTADTLFTERLKSYSLLTAVFASVAILTIFLLKWSNTMEKEVIKRTHELNRSNVKLAIMSQELKNSNLSLQKANNQLRQNDKLQKEFINMAAHELRTPIQPILGLTDVLLDKASDPHQSHLLEVIMRNARRLQRLSGDILDVSKIESSSLKLSKTPMELNEVIQTVINDFENGSKLERNKNVKIFFQPKDSIIVYIDKDRIFQVLSNLLNNALKFTKNGTVMININLDHDEKNKVVKVTIQDTGIGITQELMPNLFSKFVTSSYNGTGLGLFISKGIIEAHGGKIWAENNSNGVGASFSFSLPITSLN
ncbi:MAG TPA: sensor histidine kinase [Nitrososphaeraceae archaeon]|jgi:signal transduction histidine kinase|nr:sensor histidine kinase [Nitrososphaeraceae archaeon]